MNLIVILYLFIHIHKKLTNNISIKFTDNYRVNNK